jgi:hypothetical protein
MRNPLRGEWLFPTLIGWHLALALSPGGKADPCVLRKGLLTCDTKHTGGSGDYMLQLDAPSGARLLFGNLDGL